MWGGNYPSAFASTSALHCSKRRVVSRWPLPAEKYSGVNWPAGLKKSKRMNFHTNRVSLHNNNNNVGGLLPVGLRLHISVALQQKTGNFKMAMPSRAMQWSALTEEKQANELSQTEFRFITITIMWGGNYSPSFASTSALHCSKRRATSRWPFSAE